MTAADTNRVRTAIETTQHVFPGYWERTLEGRCGDGARGSRYDHPIAPHTLDPILRSVQWEQYDAPNLLTGRTAFRTPLAGRLGVVPIAHLPPDMPILLEDPKGTGEVTATLASTIFQGPPVDFTTIILGPEDDFEVVFAVHPGPPATHPSTIAVRDDLRGITLPAIRAR